MPSVSQDALIIVLVILLLVAVVSAQPDDCDSLNFSEWDWSWDFYSLGDHLAHTFSDNEPLLPSRAFASQNADPTNSAMPPLAPNTFPELPSQSPRRSNTCHSADLQIELPLSENNLHAAPLSTLDYAGNADERRSLVSNTAAGPRQPRRNHIGASRRSHVHVRPLQHAATQANEDYVAASVEGSLGIASALAGQTLGHQQGMCFLPMVDDGMAMVCEPASGLAHVRADPAGTYAYAIPPALSTLPIASSSAGIGRHADSSRISQAGTKTSTLGFSVGASDSYSMPGYDALHIPPPLEDAQFAPDSPCLSHDPPSPLSIRQQSRSDLAEGHQFTCNTCGLGLNVDDDLSRHLRYCHQRTRTRAHACQQCSRRFHHRKDLTRHLLKHDPNAPRFYCPQQGCKYAARGFGRLDHLERHVTTQHCMERAPGVAKAASPNGRSASPS